MLRPLSLLVAAGCVPATTIQTDPDTAAADETIPDTSAPETVVEVTEDTGVEGIASSDAEPLISPDGGAFVDSIAVTLSAPAGEGDLLYCVGDPDRACTLQPYEGPITLDEPGILLARFDPPGATGAVVARSFVAVTEPVHEFSSSLPVFVFWTDAGAPDDEDHVPMGLDVFEEGIDAAPVSSGRARLRVRGSSSASFDKSSYDLELWEAEGEGDRPEALAGMPEDGDWVLYAPYYYDEALIRNPLGYQLSNNIGRYASRTRFIEVFVADRGSTVELDDYVGLYVLTEEIERGGDRVDITELTADDNSLPEVSGGYVFKRDRSGDDESGFWAGDGNGTFSFNYPLVWVDPEESERTAPQQVYLEGLIDDLGDALAAPDFTSPATGLHYSEIIDVDAFIDHHILNILFKNPDAFRLSGYMHKDRDGLIVAGPMWDLDRTAGGNDLRCLDPLLWDATNLTSDTTPAFTWGWYGGMFNDADFRDRYFKRLSELLAGELSLENILGLIAEMEQTIGEAGDRNAVRWGAANFSGEIDNLEAWFSARHGWLTDCLDEGGDPRTCSP